MNSRVSRIVSSTLGAAAIAIAGVVGVIGTSNPAQAYTEQFGVYGTRWADWMTGNHQLVGFYVYQMPRNARPKDGRVVQVLSSKGVDVIAMQAIHRSAKERFMRSGADADLPVSRIVDMITDNYRDPSLASIRAITLDEENFWWDGRDRYLSDIYAALKLQMPRMQLWQWFNDNPRRIRASMDARFRLPADGYMLDMYSVGRNDYERVLLDYVKQGKPVVSVLWASPTWFHGGRNKGRQETWWDTEGWKDFYTRTLVNRRYGVRTALFMYDIPYNAPGNNLTPNFKSDDPCVRAFTKKLFTVTLPQLGTIPPTSPVPLDRPDWMAERCPS